MEVYIKYKLTCLLLTQYDQHQLTEATPPLLTLSGTEATPPPLTLTDTEATPPLLTLKGTEATPPLTHSLSVSLCLSRL